MMSLDLLSVFFIPGGVKVSTLEKFVEKEFIKFLFGVWAVALGFFLYAAFSCIWI